MPARLKKEWSYTSTPLLCLRGLSRVNSAFYRRSSCGAVDDYHSFNHLKHRGRVYVYVTNQLTNQLHGAQFYCRSRRQHHPVGRGIFTVRYELFFVPDAFPRLRPLVAGLSPWRPSFSPRPVNVRFVVNKVAVRQVLLLVLQLSLVITICGKQSGSETGSSASPAAFSCRYDSNTVPYSFTYSFIYHRRCVTPAVGSVVK